MQKTAGISCRFAVLAVDMRTTCARHGTTPSLTKRLCWLVLHDLVFVPPTMQFFTGSPRLPVGGFGALQPRFTVVCKVGPQSARVLADRNNISIFGLFVLTTTPPCLLRRCLQRALFQTLIYPRYVRLLCSAVVTFLLGQPKRARFAHTANSYAFVHILCVETRHRHAHTT